MFLNYLILNSCNSKTWNYGLDFAFLGNRLTGTIEYYVQNTDNVLLSVSLPPTAGVGSYMANIGKTQNKGFELSLNGVILDNLNGWTWEAGVNLYSNKNKLVELVSVQIETKVTGGLLIILLTVFMTIRK